MKINSLVLTGALVFGGVALHTAVADNPVGHELRRPNAEPESFDVKNNHARMHRAVLQARKTVGTFITALQHPSPGQQDFEVKKAFRQGNEIEHLWLSDVRLVGNRFQGRIDNAPTKIHGLKEGDPVSVNPDEISDWVFIDNGKLVGGYTIRAHYDELSPEQKKQFDQVADFRIEKR
ncbi:MAG: DUF2314 domain-containing protein [Verrucomicrobia bacterium]|nr:DUF2314 domain-containing protein [Verrucomicrobiota bacterium]